LAIVGVFGVIVSTITVIDSGVEIFHPASVEVILIACEPSFREIFGLMDQFPLPSTLPVHKTSHVELLIEIIDPISQVPVKGGVASFVRYEFVVSPSISVIIGQSGALASMITDTLTEGRASPLESISVADKIALPSGRDGAKSQDQVQVHQTVAVQVWPPGPVTTTWDPGVAPFQDTLGVESIRVAQVKGERILRETLGLQVGSQDVLSQKFVPWKTIFPFDGVLARHWKYPFVSIIVPEKLIYQNIPDQAYPETSPAQVFVSPAILGARLIQP
jgi:hypothetical protein